MKRLFTLAVLLFIAAVVTGEDISDNFIGEWQAEFFICEQADGFLVDSSADYAFPYRGISTLHFIDKEFVKFTIRDQEFRAFYEVERLDFDNFHITCTLKNGEKFLLKLTGAAVGGYKFLYRIPEDSILNGMEEDALEEEVMAAEEDVQTKENDQADLKGQKNQVEPAIGEEMTDEQVPASTYAGIIRRK